MSKLSFVFRLPVVFVLGLCVASCGNNTNHATIKAGDSTDPSALARTFLLQNKFDEAEAAFVKAIELKPISTLAAPRMRR